MVTHANSDKNDAVVHYVHESSHWKRQDKFYCVSPDNNVACTCDSREKDNIFFVPAMK